MPRALPWEYKVHAGLANSIYGPAAWLVNRAPILFYPLFELHEHHPHHVPQDALAILKDAVLRIRLDPIVDVANAPAQ